MKSVRFVGWSLVWMVSALVATQLACTLGRSEEAGLSSAIASPARIVVEPVEVSPDVPDFGDVTERWRATYRLPSPVSALRFDRPSRFHRESFWSVVTPGWRLARSGDCQMLVADPGQASSEVVVEISEIDDHLPGEYAFFLPFFDGSVAMWTGQLYASASSCETPSEDAELIRRLELSPESGGRLVVAGQVSDSPVTWEDTDERGTYVYFGEIEPVAGTGFVMIVDPWAPKWLVEMVSELFPEMFEVYGERFGEVPDRTPMVLLNYREGKERGVGFRGGTLRGSIQISIVGSGWFGADQSTAQDLVRMVAHEAVHFWNGELHRSDRGADAWMHEGSAEAFATIALERSGILRPDQLARQQEVALNRCAVGLISGPLSSALQRRDFQTSYVCGEILALWSVAAVSEDRASERLFDIWRRVFELSDPEDGSYGRDTYFAALASFGVEAEEIEALRRFLDTEHGDSSAALQELMGRVGYRLEARDRSSELLRIELAGEAVRHLMVAACDGKFSFSRQPWSFRIHPVEGCEPFDEELVVTSIAGFDLRTDGDRAYEATAGRCADGATVKLGLEVGADREVPCDTTLPRAPRELSFEPSRVSPEKRREGHEEKKGG